MATEAVPGVSRDIWSDGDYFYVAAQGTGIHAYNFDGSSFTLIDTYDTGNLAWDIWGDGEYIYLADHDDGIYAFTFNGTSFALVAQEDTAVSANSIWSDGDYFYVADLGGGVLAFDFNGSEFTLLDTYSTPETVFTVIGDSVHIYATDGLNGIYVLTFDGASFTLVENIDTPGYAITPFNDGSYIYLADSNSLIAYSGYECLSVNGWQGPTNGLLVGSSLPGNIDFARAIYNPDSAVSDHFGRSLAIDDNLMVVGAMFDDIDGFSNVGAAYVYDVNTGALISTLKNPEPAVNDRMGRTVAIENNIVVVGVSTDNPGGVLAAGSVYVFDALTGSLKLTLDNPDPTTNDFFGRTVAIDNNLIVTGAYNNDPGAVSNAGSVYVFDATTGALLTTIDNPDPQAEDVFGFWVDISGDYVVSGAHQDNPSGTSNAGIAYVFNARTGALVSTLNNPDIFLDDWFGKVVAIDGDLVAVGVEKKDVGGAGDAGTVFVFDKTSGSLVQRIDNPFPLANEAFGNKIGISGNRIISSAISYNGGAGNSGRAYVVDAVTGELLTIVENPDPSANDYFGLSTAIDGNTFSVSTYGNDPSGNNDAGSVYVYSLSDSTSFFGLDGQGDVDANILYTNNLKIANTSTDGNTITEILSLSNEGNATITQADLELIDEASAFNFFSWSEDADEHNSLILNRHRGTMMAPNSLLDGDIIGVLGFAGYDGTTVATGQNAAIYGKVNGAVSDTNVPIDLYFSTDSGGNAIDSSDMVFTQDGLLGIATETPIETLHAAQRITFDNGLRMGNDNQCSAADDYGVMRFTGSVFEYCDTGNAWVNLVDGNSNGAGPFNPELANCTVNEGGPFVELDDFNTTGSAYALWNDGRYIYVADSADGIKAYTFDGTTLSEIANYNTPGSAQAIWGDGTYLYVADGTVGGIRAYTFNGTIFTEVGNFNTPGAPQGIWGDGTYIYVADDTSGVRGYTFDGTTFIEVGSIATTANAAHVWADGTYVYVANRGDGINAYSFDGTTFTLIDTHNSGGTAYVNHIIGDGDYIYTAGLGNGVSALTFDGVAFIEIANYVTPDAITVWNDGVYIYVSAGAAGVIALQFNGIIFNSIDTLDTPDIARDIIGDGTYFYAADSLSGIRAYSGFKCLSTAEQKPDLIDWTNLEATEVKVFSSDGADNDSFGSRITATGNYLIASAVGDDDNGSFSGSVYVYDIITGAQTHKLTASDGIGNDYFGNDVSADGNFLAVGAYWSDLNGQTRSGAVYVYDLVTGAELYKLNTPKEQSQPYFGGCVLVSGDYLVVCEERDNHGGIVDKGSVHVYRVATGEYLYKITPDDLVLSDQFGARIAGYGKHALIAADNGDGVVAGTGTAYLYNLETGVLIHKFEASDGVASDQFGVGAISEKYIAIGSPLDDDNGADSGSVYVYDLETKSQIHKLTPNGPNASDSFGYNMDISGNYLFVNSEGYNSTRGAVHVFNLTTGEEINRITASDVAANDKFGDEMVVRGNTLIVGSQFGSGNTANSGGVYIYRGRYTNRAVSDTDCYPYPIVINNITGSATSTDIITDKLTLRSFANDCRLSLASESGTIDIIKNTVPVGASFTDVKAGDVIELEIRSSSTANTSVKNIVTLGDQRASFTITTAP